MFLAILRMEMYVGLLLMWKIELNEIQFKKKERKKDRKKERRNENGVTVNSTDC